MLKQGAIFIPVTDLRKSVDWYKDVLELNHVGNWQGDKGADRTHFIKSFSLL